MASEGSGKRWQRIAAYVICVRDDHVLLARWIGPDGPRWTLVGGGVDYGENPADAALRELTEETGYRGRLDSLLGIDSFTHVPAKPTASEFHAIRVVYAGTVLGGELTPERDGSTDRAEWIPFDQVRQLERLELVDRGLALYHQRPVTGQVPADQITAQPTTS